MYPSAATRIIVDGRVRRARSSQVTRRRVSETNGEDAPEEKSERWRLPETRLGLRVMQRKFPRGRRRPSGYGRGPRVEEVEGGGGWKRLTGVSRSQRAIEGAVQTRRFELTPSYFRTEKVRGCGRAPWHEGVVSLPFVSG